MGPVSNGTCLGFVNVDLREPPGETESGWAPCAAWSGTQPDKGYPGSGAPRARQAPDGLCHQGPFSVCRACLTVWRCKSSPNLMEVKGSEVQGRRREASSKGSTEQNRDLTYRNRIGGHTDRASWQRTAKPISIKGPWGKFGRCAGKTVKLTSGDLHCVRDSGLRRP